MFREKPSAKSAQFQSGARLMATAIAVGVGVVTLIFAAFALHYDTTARKMRSDEIAGHLGAVGRSTAWGVENWLGERLHLVARLGDDLGATPADANVDRLLRSKAYSDAFIWTYYGATDGGYYIWPLDDQLPADYDPRIRPWYLDALSAGKATLTEPYRDILTNVETITATTPVFRNGKLAGVAAADFSAEELTGVLKAADFGGQGFVFLASPDGRILVHPDQNLVGKALGDLFDGRAVRLEDVQVVARQRLREGGRGQEEGACMSLAPDNPLIVQGPGAGADVTAGGVFADLLRLAAHLGARI